jgi:hypothetical protein
MNDLSTGTLASVQEAIVARLCECGCGVPLSGRQKRFASRLCSSRWWDQQHPRVNVVPPEGRREGTLRQAILGFLAAHAGQWFTVHEIAEAVRAFPHSVSARLSELRRRGQPIESDARNGNSRRAHRFRLVAAA